VEPKKPVTSPHSRDSRDSTGAGGDGGDGVSGGIGGTGGGEGYGGTGDPGPTDSLPKASNTIIEAWPTNFFKGVFFFAVT